MEDGATTTFCNVAQVPLMAIMVPPNKLYHRMAWIYMERDDVFFFMLDIKSTKTEAPAQTSKRTMDSWL